MMNIQTRLKKGFRFTTILTALAGVLAIIVLGIMSTQYSDALKYYGFSQGDIGKAMVTFTETRSCTRGLIGYTDLAVLCTLSDDHDTKKESFEKYWSEVGDTIKTKAEAKIYDDVNSKLEDYWKIEKEIKKLGLNIADPGAQKQAERRASAELAPAYNEIYKGMASLMDKKVTEGDALKARLGVLSIVAFILVIVIIIVAYVIAMKIGTEVAVGISTPLDALKKRLETFSKGDLESEFPTAESKDEIADMIHVASDMAVDLRTIISDSDMLLGKMAEGDYTVTSQVKDKYAGDFVGLLMAMSRMKHQMNDVMSQINDASSLVAAGSNNLAQAAQEMAEGAMDQSASIEELQATFADITEGVEKTSEKLNETYKIAQQYAKEADNSHTEMQGMVDAIARINETSKQIENIISEIEDIASQTNLLSLNAAIEAARAGEAGKGFAVVADQIRSLSEQSAKAAVDTRELIEGAIEVTNEGNEAAERVSVSIEKVISGMKSVAASSQELSEIADAQAKAMEQAEQGINQISEVVQSNSANAEETSATSEELSAQAVTMNDLISKFSLKK
ncbi:MAG: methyl-accepting chemotaxis protein [Agathobacter sp.]|nr:methyl-accepting chemotaxis protein [Lachnospiraceae bacterium]MDY2620508.1 methyl-accepting chemotaxis protein [Agathobacter sp.]